MINWQPDKIFNLENASAYCGREREKERKRDVGKNLYRTLDASFSRRGFNSRGVSSL